MTDWIEHNGGPQPVADNVWVEADDDGFTPAEALDWARKHKYIILNQHLIDAARLEGIRLGLEAAEEAAHEYAYQCRAGGHFETAIAFATHAEDLRALDPDTIARDRLTKPAPSAPAWALSGTAKEADRDEPR